MMYFKFILQIIVHFWQKAQNFACTCGLAFQLLLEALVPFDVCHPVLPWLRGHLIWQRGKPDREKSDLFMIKHEENMGKQKPNACYWQTPQNFITLQGLVFCIFVQFLKPYDWSHDYHLQGLREECNWRPIHHMFTYLKVISETNKLVDKIGSFLPWQIFHNDKMEKYVKNLVFYIYDLKLYQIWKTTEWLSLIFVHVGVFHCWAGKIWMGNKIKTYVIH